MKKDRSNSIVPVPVTMRCDPSEVVVELGELKVTVRGSVDRDQLRSVLDVLEHR